MQPASPSLGPNYNLLEGPVHEASIYRRNGGCAVQVDAKVYVWGGEGGEKRSFDAPAQGTDSDDSDSDDESDEDQVVEDVWIVTTLPPTRLSTYPFDVYDMQTCTWSRQKTSGDAPLLGLGKLYRISALHTLKKSITMQYNITQHLCMSYVVLHTVLTVKV